MTKALATLLALGAIGLAACTNYGTPTAASTTAPGASAAARPAGSDTSGSTAGSAAPFSTP